MLRVSELFVYPVKSLGGISLPAAELTDRGFRYDRRWMLVDEQHRFLTQRQYPQMALLQPVITGEGIRIHNRQDAGEKILLPFTASGETLDVQIWDDRCSAVAVGRVADEWFSRALQMNCRVVFMPDESLRRVDPAYALHGNDFSAFSDDYPLLLISQASLDDLNSRLAAPLPMDRFRPNMVITGSHPYEEDEMAHFTIRGIDFYGVKPCSRCVVTTIDQQTGEKQPEPLRTLASYRRRNNKILFGQNVLCNQPGTVQVGDAVSVVARKPAPSFQ
ncbi:MAG: MOSC N-terminal beta barrel domain-containing protein [Chitinophagaceae bacterium]